MYSIYCISSILFVADRISRFAQLLLGIYLYSYVYFCICIAAAYIYHIYREWRCYFCGLEGSLESCRVTEGKTMKLLIKNKIIVH